MKPFQTKRVEKNLTFSSLTSTWCLPHPEWALHPTQAALLLYEWTYCLLSTFTVYWALSYFLRVTECYENKVALFFLLTDIVLLASKPPSSQSGNSWIRTAFRFWAFWKHNQSKNHFELLWKETIGIPCLPWPLSKCLHWFVDLFGFQTSSHHCQRGLSILPTSYQCLLHQDQLLVIVSVLSSNNFLQYLLSTGIKGSSLWHEFYRNKEIYNHRIIL